MNFIEFRHEFQKHFYNLVKNTSNLFVINVDKDTLWNLYLDSFPEGTNKIFRVSREFDCSCCRRFIKNFGSVVSIKDNKVITMWDFKTNDDVFQPVIDALSNFIKQFPVTDIFIPISDSFGTKVNYEEVDNNVIQWDHLFVSGVPKQLIQNKKNVPTMVGLYRDSRNVFKRSLEEFTEDSVETVLDLIKQGSLYRGEEHRKPLNDFLSYLKIYNKLSTNEKDNFCWEKSGLVGPSVNKIRNHSIGVLLIDISKNVDLDVAVNKYDKIMAPNNYKRPKAIFTKKMLEDAKKKIEELGFLDSLERRFATIDDINVNNIIFGNKDAVKKTTGNSVFDNLGNDISTNEKNFSKVEEVQIDKFIKDILPGIDNIEILLETKHSGNMVSLIAPKKSNSKTMFKWKNNFSWSYRGSVADSMKEVVKNAGGNVEGVLRFSIMWNDRGDWNNDDFDAHCIEPYGNHIYFANKKRLHQSSGMLDVDIIIPEKGVPAVENISYSNINKMPNGLYAFYVKCFCHRSGKSGFSAEIEFNGEIYSFDYPQYLKQSEEINVANVLYDSKKGFSIKTLLPSSVSSKEIWGIKTQQFHPVSVFMTSPNYWDKQDGIGNKHYFFMLDGCKNEDNPNGFFNEFLTEDLMQHKRVFEALGGKLKIENCDNQLSGVGFSSTKRDSVICKVDGKFKRILKIVF